MNAIGMVEFVSIASGIAACDIISKAAEIEIICAITVCPGKYIVLVTGEVAAVESSINAGIKYDEGMVADSFILANVHDSVIEAITNTTSLYGNEAIGIIETFSIASLIPAADGAAKAADVRLLEIRLGTGIGGKAFVILAGDVAAVKCAVETGSSIAGEKGLLVNSTVIPSPSDKLIKAILL